jgi:hypothetical protein
VPNTTLGEPRSTQVDEVLESDTGLIFFECKFTEADGGSCSQVKPLTGDSPHRGEVQCSGNYVLQVNPVNGKRSRCALTAKEVKYWEFVPQVLSIANDIDHRPCPFKGGWYQWMRNLVACYRISTTQKKQGAFVILYADGPFHMAKMIQSSDFLRFKELTIGKAIPLVTLSYQELLSVAIAAAAPEDAEVLKRLNDWVNRKVARVGGGA